MTGQAFIAVDGGGSARRAVLRDTGQACRTATDGPENAYSEMAGTAQNLRDLIEELGASPARIGARITAGIAAGRPVCRLPDMFQSLGTDPTERLVFSGGFAPALLPHLPKVQRTRATPSSGGPMDGDIAQAEGLE